MRDLLQTLPPLDFSNYQTIESWAFLRRVMMDYGRDYRARTEVVASIVLLGAGSLVLVMFYFILVLRELAMTTLAMVASTVALVSIFFVGSCLLGIPLNKIGYAQVAILSAHESALHRQLELVTVQALRLRQEANAHGEDPSTNTEVMRAELSQIRLRGCLRQLQALSHSIHCQSEQQSERIFGITINAAFLRALSAVGVALVSVVYDVVSNDRLQ